MKEKIAKALLVPVALFMLSAYSCSGSGTPANGFTVHIEEIIVTDVPTDFGPMSGIAVTANWQFDLSSNVSGTVTSVPGQRTDSSGNVNVSNARLPAKWFIGFNDSRCAGSVNDSVALNPGDTATYDCITFSVGLVSVSPNPIDQTNLSTVTVSGQGFDPTYGMPLVEFRTLNGVVIGQATASWLSSDHTQLIASASSMAGQIDGSFSAIVYKAQSDGTYMPIGAGRFDSTGNPPGGGGGGGICQPDGSIQPNCYY